VLTLAGTCEMPPTAVTPDRREQVRLELIEASREFITGVARDMTSIAGPGPEHDPLDQAWAW
jgi:hypothetical protein